LCGFCIDILVCLLKSLSDVLDMYLQKHQVAGETVCSLNGFTSEDDRGYCVMWNIEGVVYLRVHPTVPRPLYFFNLARRRREYQDILPEGLKSKKDRRRMMITKYTSFYKKQR